MFRVNVPTTARMKQLGRVLAGQITGGEVIVLSGPLGAGKTTLTQGFGQGLHVDAPVVSPTFTIARELHGHTVLGEPVRLIHVDAYRLGSTEYEPGQNSADRLLDELESLGLDEELEDPDEHSVVLMEWGQQMASALAQERLEVYIERLLSVRSTASENSDCVLSSDGLRVVSIHAVGSTWTGRMSQLEEALAQ